MYPEYDKGAEFRLHSAGGRIARPFYIMATRNSGTGFLRLPAYLEYETYIFYALRLLDEGWQL